LKPAARLKSFSKAADELSVAPAPSAIRSMRWRRSRGGPVRRLRAHNDTGTLTVTASPSITAKWLVLRLHRFQERCPDIDGRISATDEVVDLIRGDYREEQT